MPSHQMLFAEPVKMTALQFALVERRLLKVSPFQREKHSTLTKNLADSIADGFLVPIVVVEVDGLFEIIDGQHRIEALDKQCSGGDFQVPCIIVPLPYRELFLSYNIELADNIKDKAMKVYNFYTYKLGQFPELPEIKLGKSFSYESFIITIAFAYKELDLSSPSLVESPVKKLDKEFFQYPLRESIELRRGMAIRVKELENLVNETASTYSINDFNLKKAIVSKASGELWGRKRNIDETFDEGMQSLIAQIKQMDWSWMAYK